MHGYDTENMGMAVFTLIRAIGRSSPNASTLVLSNCVAVDVAALYHLVPGLDVTA